MLVGIPDVAAYRPRTETNYTTSNVAVATPPVRPVTVTVPMPEEVREGYLEIISMETGEVVTVIEVLSPTNRRPGKGRQMYEEKRDRFSQAKTYHQLGMVAQKLRSFPEARQFYQEVLAIYVEYGDRFSQASTYFQLGRVAVILQEI